MPVNTYNKAVAENAKRSIEADGGHAASKQA